MWDIVCWAAALIGGGLVVLMFWSMWQSSRHLVDEAHASRFNHLKVLGVEEVRPFIPAANPFTRPELSQAEIEEGWSIIDAGGMWVKTIDVNGIGSITIDFTKGEKSKN